MNPLTITMSSRKKLNTYGVAHSHTFVGRVTRFARQPCPIKNGTPVGFTLLLNHILYEITETISGKLLFQKGELRKGSLQIDEPHRGSAFDSPGLARNEPTLGKHSQGDSTP